MSIRTSFTKKPGLVHFRSHGALGPRLFFSVAFALNQCPPHVRVRASLRRIRLTAVKRAPQVPVRRLAALNIDGAHARPQRQWGRAGMAPPVHRGEVLLERLSPSEGSRRRYLPSMLVTIADHRASGVSLPVTISASVWPQFQTVPPRGSRGERAALGP